MIILVASSKILRQIAEYSITPGIKWYYSKENVNIIEIFLQLAVSQVTLLQCVLIIPIE